MGSSIGSVGKRDFEWLHTIHFNWEGCGLSVGQVGDEVMYVPVGSWEAGIGSMRILVPYMGTKEICETVQMCIMLYIISDADGEH